MSVVLRIFHCACAKWPYFHFRSKIWHHHRVPRPRFPLRRGNFGDPAINKRYIAYFLLRMREMRPYFHFLSKIWHHHRVPQPWFPLWRGSFGHSAINERYIAYFSLCISTSGLKSDVTIVFLGPDFLLRHVNLGDLHTFKADILRLNICMGFQDLLS